MPTLEWPAASQVIELPTLLKAFQSLVSFICLIMYDSYSVLTVVL